MPAVQLSAGDLKLSLEPQLGGCVSAFSHADVHLMRPISPPAEQAPHALHSGMFPMVPFANSLRDNRFEFEGRAYEVAPNMAGSRLNYHGSGWQRPWRVAGHSATACHLVLAETPETSGYAFAAEQQFALSPDALDVRLTVTNRSPRRMPFGIGLHPWFVRHGDARVTFAATAALQEDADFHAVGFHPVAQGEDFSTGREPPRSFQNRCYAGWGGYARVDWPSLGRQLSVDADPLFEHLMFHVPSHDPEVFCLEPQSNRTSAFDGLETGHPAPGVHLLEPGQSLSGSVVFGVRRTGG